MQLNAAHARLPAIDRGLDLEQARRIHEAEERGRAQGEARMYSILTPEEISSREAQLARVREGHRASVASSEWLRL